MKRQLRVIVRLAGLALLLAFLGGCSWLPWRKDKPATPAPNAVTAAEIATATADATDTQAAAALALDFYEMHQRLGNSGLPEAGEMNAYGAFLCPNLVTLVVGAQERQKQYRLAHPEDKPPLVEGDLFSSLFEGPDTVRTAGAAVDGDTAEVIVAMQAGSGDGATRWKDTLLLARNDGVWCVDDVEYHGDWQFANKGRLSDSLRAEF